MIRFLFLFLFFGLFLSCEQPVLHEQKAEKLFVLLPSKQTNITFKNAIKEDYYNFFGVFNYAYNGAGLAIGDINNDGLADIYFVGNQYGDKLYLNKGNFKFEDITSTAGIKPKLAWHNGVTMVDINNDGFLDIYITVGGWNEPENKRANQLYVNQGDQTFVEMGEQYGIADKGFSIMASFFDMDGDNDLDLYLTNRPQEFFLEPEQVLQGKKESPSFSKDKLYRNEAGIFTDVSTANGITDTFGYGLGLTTSDFDKDGDVDVYVGNDFFENDYYFKNNGSGIFREDIANFSNHVSFYTMGVDAVDFNNDGFEDVFALDMYPEDYVRSKTTMAPMNVDVYRSLMKNGFYPQYMHNVLNLNNGNGFFSDVAQLAGVNGTDWSWACLGADYDNDGDNDLFITNGYRRDLWDRDANEKRQEYTAGPRDPSKTPNQIIKEVVELYPAVKLQNYIFENNGDLKFENRAEEWGLGEVSFSNGAAFGDLDNDGDLDLVVNNIDDEAFIYENKSEKVTGNNYVKIRLRGPEQNILGVGTKITLFQGDSIQYKDHKTVRGYLSSVEPMVHFGLGPSEGVDSVLIEWNDGKRQLLKNVKANNVLEIAYQDATLNRTSLTTKIREPLFKEESTTAFDAPVRHTENSYDDFKKQVLLPHKLSGYGPAMAVGDVNENGLQDIYLGGSKGRPAQLMLQTASGKFVKATSSLSGPDKFHEDVYAEFLDIDNDEDLDLYVVSGGNELEADNAYYQDRIYSNDGSGNFTKLSQMPDLRTSGACVVPIDFDSDGDLDLFVGSRHVPGKYPSPPSSFLLENNEGEYTDVTQEKAGVLQQLGMVTAATAQNIDGDEKAELIIVGEWMNITVLKWADGEFKNSTSAAGLANTAGWWNTIEAADIDNDGDMDFVVGNLGTNYKFKASPDKPFYVFADDYDNNGTHDIFLAKPLDDRLVPIRGKECSTQQLPSLGKKFASYQEFAEADISAIIGQEENTSVKYSAQLFESVILMNENGKFTIKKLPVEAQFSVVNGIVIADFNADGVKDILIAGNRFEVEIETTRSDASVGLVMLGKANGDFKALTPSESGIFIPENAKGLKSIVLPNGDLGILVAINNGHLKLYRNNLGR